MCKIILSANTCWNVYNFRRALISSLLNAGFEVTIVAPEDEYTKLLKAIGCKFVNINIQRKSQNLLLNFLIIWQYYRIFKKIKPDFYLGFTIKPNIFGSFVSQLLNIDTINNISGLGSSFLRNTIIRKFTSTLYKFALRRSKIVFFQNNDDRDFFVNERIIDAKKSRILPGSGINLQNYKFTPMSHQLTLHFLLIARMIKDKGIVEFVNAARLVKKQNPNIELSLLGPIDKGNPSSIDEITIQKWEKEGAVNYLGHTEDVRGFIKSAHCVVLPSYREGTPRTLLEACAMGRPIITTNVPGCRQVVKETNTGFLCEPYSEYDLAEKILRFSRLSSRQIDEMGRNARIHVENTYDETIVVSEYLNVLRCRTIK